MLARGADLYTGTLALRHLLGVGVARVGQHIQRPLAQHRLGRLRHRRQRPAVVGAHRQVLMHHHVRLGLHR